MMRPYKGRLTKDVDGGTYFRQAEVCPSCGNRDCDHNGARGRDGAFKCSCGATWLEYVEANADCARNAFHAAR